MKRILALALVVSAGWPAAATAQDGWGWSVIVPSVTGTDQLGLHLRDQLAKQKQDGPPAEAAPGSASLRYVPSSERRTVNLRNFVERSRRVDPAGAQQLQGLFAAGDIIDKMAAVMAQHGFRADDLGDVYALWWITAWQASRGHNDDQSPALYAAVRGQARRALADTPALAGAGDAAKQEFAESLMLQSLLIDAAVEQAKGDPARLGAVGAAAAQGARGMGLDLSAMTLTENGFVPG